MEKYNPSEIEKKWQKVWRESGIYKTAEEDAGKPKYYILDMFPYPSGDGLHMGHTESYTSTDIFYRYKKMRGFNVLHPQGFDAFGLPAENYAIKTKIHPRETTKTNMANYEKQMDSLGFGYDWDKKIITASPEYYKWTQWIFARFFENGLVYKKTDKINWCDSCKTGVANEQVVDGACERCKNQVIQKEIPGWFFKITDFAEDLIKDLDKVDWPEHTKVNQKNWIGKSEGTLIKFLISKSKFLTKSQNPNDKIENQYIEVFTTRVDTVFGCTYVVVAPEHAIVSQLETCILNLEEVKNYLENTKKKSELERIGAKDSPSSETSAEQGKTGVELKGIRAINPFTGEEVPVFVADYVLGHYGTGAVMAVPAHDIRDYEFSVKYSLLNKEVVMPDTQNQNTKIKIQNDNSKLKSENAFTEDGVLIDSGEFSKMTSVEARSKMTAWLEKTGNGSGKVNYRLRDWSVSRQRYWGAPIPVVYDSEGKAHIVSDEHLPWLLPEDVDFVPTGESPLKKSKEFFERTEKIFGKGWTPECDTMDTFVCSSWYYLAYPMQGISNFQFPISNYKKVLEYWLPVDTYIGGAEHTYMHLLYARFFTKALHKIGVINFDEPFLKLRHQGMVLDKNGVKMSKSKGNVTNPDEMVAKFGADAVRMYMMFLGPLEDEKMWDEKNIIGVVRFLEKVWKMQYRLAAESLGSLSGSAAKLETLLHKTIKKVGEDLEEFKFNTAISTMMILANEMDKESQLLTTHYSLLTLLLAPFAPHFTEELWSYFAEATKDKSLFGNTESIHKQPWPQYDPAKIKESLFQLVAQVNGKTRDVFEAPADIDENNAKVLTLERENVRKYITDEKAIKKTIFVPNKLINFII